MCLHEGGEEQPSHTKLRCIAIDITYRKRAFGCSFKLDRRNPCKASWSPR
jgi:hypothetical protein